MALLILSILQLNSSVSVQGNSLFHLVERLRYSIVALPVPSRNIYFFSYLQTLSNQKHVSIQSKSYLASNTRHYISTGEDKFRQQKHKLQALANLIHWFGNRELISLPYNFKLCSFCSKGFLLPLCALDGLRYFIEALPGPSIYLFFIVTRSMKYPESSLDRQVAQASGGHSAKTMHKLNLRCRSYSW